MRFFRSAALALVSIALLAALGTLLPRPLWRDGEVEPPSRRILVLQNPIHTDIAIPLTADVRERFAFLQSAGIPVENPAAEWLVVGWGGRAFYLETPTWSDLKLRPVLKALTVDNSVLHIDVTGEMPEPHPSIAGFEVGEQGFQRMLSFVEMTFRGDRMPPAPIDGVSYGRTDRFFEADGTFNAMVGCNVWTAKALREAGLRTGWWNPLPVALMLSMRLYN